MCGMWTKSSASRHMSGRRKDWSASLESPRGIHMEKTILRLRDVKEMVGAVALFNLQRYRKERFSQTNLLG